MSNEERDDLLRRFIERRKADPSHKAWLASVQHEINTGQISEGLNAEQIRQLFLHEPTDTGGD